MKKFDTKEIVKAFPFLPKFQPYSNGHGDPGSAFF